MSIPPARQGLDATHIPGALRLPEVIDGLKEWMQGDLVQDIGLFWAGTQDHDEITGLAVPSPGGHTWPVVAWDGTPATTDDESDADQAGQQPKWAIITSQTCDVVGTGPGARHPVVQVSPLINLEGVDPNKVTAIGRLANVDLTPVTHVPGGGQWAADLRISLPVSKAVLLHQDRVHGFTDPYDQRVFSERVAAKIRRPAVHDQLSTEFVASLNQAIAQANKLKQTWVESIEQFRLLVTVGDRLHPRNIAVLVVATQKLPADERQPLRDWRNTERKRLLKSSNITLDPLRFCTVDTIGVRDYRQSDWIRTTELGQPPYW